MNNTEKIKASEIRLDILEENVNERLKQISSEVVKKNFSAVQSYMTQTTEKVDQLETLIKEKDAKLGTMQAEIQILKRQITTVLAQQYGNGPTA